MNNLNPLHIVALLVVILIFFTMKLSGAKDDLTQNKELYKETLQLATELKGLKKIYPDKNGVKKSINRILKQSSLKSANIKQKVANSSMVLSSESMSKTALNSLMGKLLNGSYNISSLKIKKLSEKNASLSMEIKW